MKVKNISGATLTFKAGKRTYTIGNNVTTTIDDTLDALNDAIENVEAGRLELVTVPAVASYAGTPARYGYADINLNSTLADGDILTIAGVVFEFDTAASNSITAGRTRVLLDAGPAHATTAAALKTAINADTTLIALGLVADEIISIAANNAKLILKATGSTVIGDITISQTGDGVDITKVDASEGIGYRTSVTKVTATAVTALVNTGLETVHGVIVTVTTSAGVSKAYNGVARISGGFVHLDDSGTVDIASTDIVNVVAYGK